AGPQDEPVTVIEGGTLIDGTGAAPLRDAVVVIRGNRIAAVGRKGQVRYPKTARVISAEGKFILPGLIDAHVHYHEWQGELHLAHGVTTVKDTGNPVEWLEALSKAIAAGEVVGPRLFYTGNSMTSPPALKDHHIGLRDPEMGRRAVRILKKHGAIAAKVHQQITPELLRAITDEAHKLGLPVTGHLRRIGAREAALAGIDALEHSTGIPRSAGANPNLLKTDDPENDLVGYYDDLNEAAEMREENFAPLIRLLVEKKVAIVPTLITWFRIATDNRAKYAQEDAAFAKIAALKYVPESIREIWRTSFLYEPPSAGGLERFRTAYAKMSRFLKSFHEAGGRLVAGSSTSVMVPGLSMHREMEMFVKLGLTPREVIEIVTRRNAEFMRIDKDLGTLTTGKLADLIVVEQNPLEDIKNIGRIALVMKDGKVVDTSYHADYRMPIPRPKLTRPVWLEQQLK
ncbi:MAG TPA: amidohydrolase family protein, partial [Blastocatellia bacterium]|nr:amidohydrolase family protein [Blastocatellia bacterium]